MRLAGCVEPGFVVEANSIDDERVAFPFSDRLACPALRFDIEIVRAAVQEKSSVTMSVALPQQHYGVRALHDLIRQRINSHRAVRQAEALRIIFAFVRLALVINLFCPSLIWGIARQQDACWNP